MSLFTSKLISFSDSVEVLKFEYELKLDEYEFLSHSGA